MPTAAVFTPHQRSEIYTNVSTQVVALAPIASTKLGEVSDNIIFAVSTEIYGLYFEAQNALQLLSLDTTTGSDLDNVASEYPNLAPRQQPTKATGVETVTDTAITKRATVVATGGAFHTDGFVRVADGSQLTDSGSALVGNRGTPTFETFPYTSRGPKTTLNASAPASQAFISVTDPRGFASASSVVVGTGPTQETFVYNLLAGNQMIAQGTSSTTVSATANPGQGYLSVTNASTFASSGEILVGTPGSGTYETFRYSSKNGNTFVSTKNPMTTVGLSGASVGDGYLSVTDASAFASAGSAYINTPGLSTSELFTWTTKSSDLLVAQSGTSSTITLPSTTLAVTIPPGATSAQLTSAAAFPSSGIAQFGPPNTEPISYASKSGNTLNFVATTLATNVNPGDTSINLVDGSHLPTSGFVYLAGGTPEVFQYTSRLGNVISTTGPGASNAHLSGTAVTLTNGQPHTSGDPVSMITTPQVGDSALTIANASSFPSSGSINLNTPGNPNFETFVYTSKSGNSLLSTSDTLNFAHAVGETAVLASQALGFNHSAGEPVATPDQVLANSHSIGELVTSAGTGLTNAHSSGETVIDAHPNMIVATGSVITSLTVAANIGDTSITVGSVVGLPSSGAVNVGSPGSSIYETFIYTSIVSNTLMSTSDALTSAHAFGEQVQNVTAQLADDHGAGEPVVDTTVGDRSFPGPFTFTTPATAVAAPKTYVSTSPLVIFDGESDGFCNIQSNDFGPAGNTPAETITAFVGIPPFNTARPHNDEDLNNGMPLESDADLRQRIRRERQALSTASIDAVTSVLFGINNNGQRVKFVQDVEDTNPLTPTILYIDDGSGSVPTTVTITSPIILKASASGGETHFRIPIANLPIVTTLSENAAQVYANIVIQKNGVSMTQGTGAGQYQVQPNSGLVKLMTPATAGDNYQVTSLTYFSGLIGLANKALYGDPNDTADFPGVVGLGEWIQPRAPNVEFVAVVGSTVLDGTRSLTDVVADQMAAIQSYISSLGIAVTVIANRVQALGFVAGVQNFTLTSLGGISPATDVVIPDGNLAKPGVISLT